MASTTKATPAEMLVQFAERVRHARLTAGFASQRQLGDALGIHHSAVSNWERALRFAATTDLYALAKTLRVTVDCCWPGTKLVSQSSATGN